MNCRVCNTGDLVVEHARIQPYTDFSCMVYHCGRCGSRFVTRDATIYESLHGNPESSYASHRDVATLAAEAYRSGDRLRLRGLLDTSTKNRFIMDTIDALPASNLLEIGCSRGYLTSYFLLTGHRVLGTDVSETAVDGARRLFGEHFCLVDRPPVDQRAPYDAIYHVGTIGCVESPIELTDRLLDLLKPGGLLLFNAPNVAAAEWQRLAWVRGTYPPDLVWLFHPDLWRSRYGRTCDVEITIETEALGDSLGDARRRGVEVVATNTLARSRADGALDLPAGETRSLRRTALESLRSALNLLSPFAPGLCRPTDFGMHVVLRKRGSA